MILGFDIGGTKCAVITAHADGEAVTLTARRELPTRHDCPPEEMIAALCCTADEMCAGERLETIGISCGGPLNSATGVIEGPPNLPGWDAVPITDIMQRHFRVPACLQNDANACAVAEWKFGAGKGTRNMIFLTFGTGLGAGLILDGRLYEGTNGNAGEVGHIRLDRFGPVGYGKQGSFEGFCSGGGLAQLGYSMALEAIQKGVSPAYFHEGMRREEITAKSIAAAAAAGDETALEVYRICGAKLGQGLSVLIDVLNPERIVIGSIFRRAESLLRTEAERVIRSEALQVCSVCCQVVPAALGEQIGDYAAIAAACR